MFNFFLQTMHVMKAYVVLILASAKTDNSGMQ